MIRNFTKYRSISVLLFSLVHIAFSQEQIRFTSAADVEAKRDSIINYIWGSNGFPTQTHVDSVESNIIFTDLYNVQPYTGLYSARGNLSRIDRYTVNLPFGFIAKLYHLIPINRNGKLIIYHSGHVINGDTVYSAFQIEDMGFNNNGVQPGDIIPFLLQQGYDVLADMMPLFGDNRPTVNIPAASSIRIPTGPITFTNHSTLFDYSFYIGNPFVYFFTPLAVALNYVDSVYHYGDNIFYDWTFWRRMDNDSLPCLGYENQRKHCCCRIYTRVFTSA